MLSIDLGEMYDRGQGMIENVEGDYSPYTLQRDVQFSMIVSHLKWYRSLLNKPRSFGALELKVSLPK